MFTMKYCKLLYLSWSIFSKQIYNPSTVIHQNKTPSWTINLLEKGSYFDSMLFLADFGGSSTYGVSKLISLFLVLNEV